MQTEPNRTERRLRAFLGNVEQGPGPNGGRRQPVKIYAELRLVDTLNDPDRTRETTDHRTIRAGDVPSIAVTWEYGTARELAAGMGSGGAGIDPGTVAGLAPTARARAERILELSARWHLNDMTPGCIHQPAAWKCSEDGRLNGWPIIEREGRSYPARGDACLTCGRNRWDEPTDACPETGYGYGRAWLVTVPPDAVVAELQGIFGGPAGWADLR
jgi:hypothetical protein